MKLKKILSILILVSVLVSCQNAKSINFNKDIKNMGYENVIETEKKNDTIVLKKQDDSEFTQKEMDDIYEYISNNYIKNDKYETNVIYKTNYKEINIEIKEK